MKNPIIFQKVPILGITDGDTYHVDLDLSPLFGHPTDMKADIRAAFINAAELDHHHPERTPDGVADLNLAKLFFLGSGEAKPFTLEVFGRDKYGRVLAEAWMPDLSGLSFSQHMLASKTVVPMKLTTQLPPDVR